MKKVFYNYILFCILLLLVIYGLDMLYSKTMASKPINKIIWIFDKQNDNYDFAVLGNSRVLNSIDVKAMESESHLKGINLGTRGSKLPENYLVLERFLRTNKVKTVLLQLDITIVNRIVSPSNDRLPFFETFALMPYIHDDDVYDVISKCALPAKYLPWKYIPFARYAEFNTEYRPDKIFGKPDFVLDESGYQVLHDIHHGKIYADTTMMGAVSDSLTNVSLLWADKIVEMCKKSNIKLILFTAPVHRVEFLYPATGYTIGRLQQYAHKNDLPYWNLSTLFINSPDSVYQDAFHTNYLAAPALAKTLADSLAGQ